MANGVATPLPHVLTGLDTLRTAIEGRLDSLSRDGVDIDLPAVSGAIDWYEAQTGTPVPRDMQRALMRQLSPNRDAEETRPGAPADTRETVRRTQYMPDFGQRLNALTRRILPDAMAELDLRALTDLPLDTQRERIRAAVLNVSRTQKLELNGAESAELVDYVINDMMGLGPLERLLADDEISDIMVNGPHQVYVERRGMLELTDITFRDNQHVLNIASRIVTSAGRRVDESTPLVDARLADGSRINVTIPPLSLDGPTMTIRKFPKDELTLADLAGKGSLSPRMAEFLRIAARMRLNILISGGTGSGKTTMLNAVSREIPVSERIVTIEDAAELRLQQPHVIRLETRPATLEGTGEITMRQLFRNALRMRPDRIIIGEVRGDEALDLLQAMNTGHDGSMSTLHANSAREAMTRVENMIAMSGVGLATEFVRHQMKDAVHLVVQVSRQRDGARRVTAISELVGIEGNVISMQDLFAFRPAPGASDEQIAGHYEATGSTPHFMQRARDMGLETALRQVLEG